MFNWTIEKLNLQLKYTWRLSRNATASKVNFCIKAASGGHTGMGEVAPNIRYQETPEKILSEFAIILNNELPILKNLDALKKLLDQFKISNALRCGLEGAYIDWLCKKENISKERYLNLKPVQSIATSFTIPIMETGKVNEFFLKHDLHRFRYIKVKVNAETGFDLIKEVNNITDQPLMIDANEAWKDVEAMIVFLEKLKDFNILFIEQPLPSSLENEYEYLKTRSPYDIMADESITSKPDFASLKKQFHGINMKLMKAGGLVNGLRIIREAKMYNMKTMIGCMVETSLGISEAMHLADLVDFVDLDSFMYIENEPFKLIKEDRGILNFIK